MERAAASPLSQLRAEDRLLLIRALTRELAETEATPIIAALGSTPEETAALPNGLQDQALAVIVRAFAPGHGAVIVSQLGIARVGTDAWLPGVREHFDGMSVDAAIDEIRRDMDREAREGLPS